MPAKPNDESPIAEALHALLMSPNVADSNGEAANLVDVIDDVARAIRFGLKNLGNGDAATPMGAIEAHGAAIKEAGAGISAGLHAIADAINGLADAIREKGY